MSLRDLATVLRVRWTVCRKHGHTPTPWDRYYPATYCANCGKDLT